MKEAQRATTLLELLTVISVLAITLALGIPTLQDMLHANRARTLHDQLRASLQAARVHSIEQRQEVEICGSGDGITCRNDWRRGWLVREKNSGQVLHSTRLSSAAPLIWKGLSKRIRYHPDGHSHASNGTFTYCSAKQGQGWSITLNRQGRVRSTHAITCTP